MVILDASFLLLMIEPDAKPPTDPTTKKPLDKCKERIENLVIELTKAKVTVAVPAPALAEFLVRAKAAATQYLEEFQNARVIRVEPFGHRAAVECAFLIDGAVKAGKKRTPADTWAKLKYDRQILAIAKVVGASTLYTTDESLAKLAAQNGIKAVNVHELPLPAGDPQISWLAESEPEE